MRRVPAQYTGVILAALALVLVLGLVEINDIDHSSLTVQPAAVDTVRTDTTVATEEQPDCVQVESDFFARLEQSRSCTTDADCTLTSFGCPFECVASVGKSELDVLQREEASFQRACHRCVSECPATLVRWRAACVRQRCIVLDRSIDELEEETLRLMDESS